MNKKLISLSFLCIALLAGCGHQYQIRPLKHVKKTEAQFSEKKDNIELRVKKLSQTEVKQIFNNQYMVSKHITPLLITIKNDSAEAVTLDNQTIELKLLSSEQIQEYLSRSICSKILAGIFAVPTVIITSVFGGVVLACLLGLPCEAIAFPFLASVFIGTPIIAGTTGHSIHDANKFNKALATDLKRKVLTVQTIDTGKKESALLFAKDLPGTFTITLLKGQQPVLFAVTLKNQEPK